ncbi:MAG TPA: hypothetical protein VET83_06440 [Candidatus Dormibacteraeota bacterium]|nr:hypothetical protein [Candidatus Dormibacteraeota bacterium]
MGAAKPWLLGALVTVVLAGCGNTGSNKPLTSKLPEQTGSPVVFDSGRGTGQFDAMTYAKYASSLVLTPQVDMIVRGIRPQIWYCNGASGFLAFIRDEHYGYLEAEAGLVDGTGGASPKFSDRQFDTPLTLKAGTHYLIEMEVWTTKSVGIYTTGSRTTGVVGSATYSVSTATASDRGAVAFEMIQ